MSTNPMVRTRNALISENARTALNLSDVERALCRHRSGDQGEFVGAELYHPRQYDAWKNSACPGFQVTLDWVWFSERFWVEEIQVGNRIALLVAPSNPTEDDEVDLPY